MHIYELLKRVNRLMLLEHSVGILTSHFLWYSMTKEEFILQMLILFQSKISTSDSKGLAAR